MPLVVNRRRGSFVGAGVEFKPGANEVPEDALYRALDDASVASWFALGFLVLDESSKAEAQVVSPSPAVEDAPAAAPEFEAPQPKRRRRGG